VIDFVKFRGRFSLLYIFFLIFIAVSTITRTTLLIKALPNLDISFIILIKIYAVGFFYDAVTFTYFVIPYALYVMLAPDKIFLSRYHKALVYMVFLLTIYILLFGAVAEYIFFDEFGVRFNFIAVDYLIYTHEVVKNIMESYPIPAILTAIAVISLIILMSLRKWLDMSISIESSFKHRIKSGLVFLVIPVFSYAFVDLDWAKISSNNYANELSANGIYSLFAAFRNNKINYETFYATRDNRAVFQDLRSLLIEDNNSFANDNIFDITREIKNTREEKRLNVMTT
jgi:hypothetical protein